MADTTFVSKLPPAVSTAWLQDLNDLFYRGTKNLTVPILTASTKVVTPQVVTPLVSSSGSSLQLGSSGNVGFEVVSLFPNANWLQATGSAAFNNSASLKAVGTDSSIEIFIQAKGPGAVYLVGNGAIQFESGQVVSTTSWLRVSGSSIGTPTISIVGTGTVTITSPVNITSQTTVTLANTQAFRVQHDAASTWPAFAVNTASANPVNGLVVIASTTGNDVQVGVLSTDTDNGLRIDAKGAGRLRLNVFTPTGDIQWGRPLVALGGGAAPTLGTIGGTGPATAAQNTWMRLLDSTGAAFWVPAWK